MSTFRFPISTNLSRMLLLGAPLLAVSAGSPCLSAEGVVVVANKQLIGPIATVEETESDLPFKARVDTGATTCSLHAEDWVIEDEAEEMSENVGKTIRFRVRNHRGKTEWLTRKIAEIGVIKTSEQEEERYKVRMTLRYQDVKKKVLVSLNDRSHMNYPVLLGRNFLQGDFVVDVDLKKDRRSRKKSEKREDSGATRRS